MSENTTILCVDDERDVVEALHDTLMDDYNVMTALSGKEALEIFENNKIALVISDQRMPGMEGTELLKQINEKDSSCKKILLTGYADINAAVDSINKSGVDRYFNKPWDDEELLTAIKHLLKMHDLDTFMSKALSKKKDLINNLAQKEREVEGFSAYLNGFAEGICILDDDQDILYCNSKALQILGATDSTEIVGKQYTEIFPIDQKQKDAFVETGEQKAFPLAIKLPTGDSVEAQLTLHGEAGQDGKHNLCGIVFTAK
jgi:response regulator RpfG family c-di-GMP phosphodiesterase